MTDYTLSDETKERLTKLIELGRVTVHYGWIPFIVYLGWTQSVPRPNLFKLLSPLPTP
ncbi:similar to Saccharomyces cerevisiae YNL070W TOM7 Component of the TOM (translocase of outer membrane) complex [Geotrichum candidum]|uniref:Similar to Saccharomyces cerevisiae YNL070W TOM7 Component of the TOM (Translocase of outer membrane) complex n=1 Tax=Geotrichum candidum TaxID=1173061 RepID=A0A0J9XHA0_GEOCN|nr:similar to Saccharomyces cerevisiae YNL070W TOM7 Component of the TOM (translocase of outer membrane) complex [Geotrichum candidum]